LMGDEGVVEYDDDDEEDDKDNEEDDDGDDDEDDDDNATINCWQQLGKRIREKETMTMMTTTTLTMTTMAMMKMTMTKQSTVGNNWGSRIGETETVWGCGMTEENHEGGNLVEFFELNKINSKRVIHPPQSKRRTGT
jgi:hypothetical protein